MGYTAKSVGERLEKHTVRGYDPDCCWDWVGAVNADGRGQISCVHNGKIRPCRSAHSVLRNTYRAGTFRPVCYSAVREPGMHESQASVYRIAF